MWIIGGIAWLRQLEKRIWCFAISAPTVVRTDLVACVHDCVMCIGFEFTQILECITINLTLVYALHAYSGIKNKNPETLLVMLLPTKPHRLKSVVTNNVCTVSLHYHHFTVANTRQR